MANMLVLFLLSVASIVLAEDPLVSIKLGQLLGQWRTSAGGRTYASFEGVPYAVPPVGQYRFVVRSARSGTMDWCIERIYTQCLQYDQFALAVKGEEDCLHLNVYTPKLDSSALLPVLVYIHGGAFMYGSGGLYGPDRLMDVDMVVVTINYRLGVLGFFSTGDTVVPGNVGLKDQSLALSWVNQYIEQFGGDPNNIIAYGQSSGASSIHYHLLSPRSQGKFHRAIMSSATALSSWRQVHPETRNKKLSELVACTTNTNQEMVDCLRNQPAEKIVNATPSMFNWRGDTFSPFEPVIEAPSENAFIDKSPYELTKEGLFDQVPVLLGCTSDEALYPAVAYKADPTYLQELEGNWTEYASYLLRYNETLPDEYAPEVGAKIKEFYFNNQPVSVETFDELVKVVSDRHFYSNIGEFASLYTAKSKENAYIYQYSYRGEKGLTDYLGLNVTANGVAHTDDLHRIFKVPNFDLTREDDLHIIQNLIHIIYSFASTGRPTVPDNSFEWPPIAPGDNVNGVNIVAPNDMQLFEYHNFGNRTFWDSLGINKDL